MCCHPGWAEESETWGVGGGFVDLNRFLVGPIIGMIVSPYEWCFCLEPHRKDVHQCFTDRNSKSGESNMEDILHKQIARFATILIIQ